MCDECVTKQLAYCLATLLAAEHCSVYGKLKDGFLLAVASGFSSTAGGAVYIFQEFPKKFVASQRFSSFALNKKLFFVLVTL